MSSTIHIELTDHDGETRHGIWTNARTMDAYAYPTDTETFAERISETTYRVADSEDRDIYETDDYQTLLNDLDPATRDAMPDPPEGWEHAEATITILW